MGAMNTTQNHPKPSPSGHIARLICFVVAVMFGFATLYCLLWIASSSSMAFIECSGRYQLFSSNARCRQPPLAALLALASCVLAVSLVWLGSRLGKRRLHNGA